MKPQTRAVAAMMSGARIRYLLRDEFITALAAGSVNGTSAEPGPGTRTVVDTGSRLSISAGTLIQTANSTGDPGYWLDNVGRTAGRVVIAKSQASAAQYHYPVGVDSGQDGAPRIATTFTAALEIKPFENGTNGPVIGSWAALTDYEMSLVIRSAGAYYFIKGGAFTNWTLLWFASANNDANVYPYISASLAPTLTSYYIRVPDRLWLPTPLAYDTFTRANGALGNTETSGPDSQSTPARAWTNRVGTTQVSSNAASASALSGGIAIATVDTGTINTVFSSALTRSGDEIGVVLRYADSSNYIRAYHDGTNAKLDKIVAGSPTGVISAAQAYSAGANIVVVADGTSFSLYYNNTQIGSTSTISDAALQTGTEQGTYSTNTGNSQDTFQVFPRGTSNEYQKLSDF